jgi:hypothetical protein
MSQRRCDGYLKQVYTAVELFNEVLEKHLGHDDSVHKDVEHHSLPSIVKIQIARCVRGCARNACVPKPGAPALTSSMLC